MSNRWTLLDVLIEIYIGWYIIFAVARQWHEYVFHPRKFSHLWFWINLNGSLGVDSLLALYDEIDTFLAKFGIKNR